MVYYREIYKFVLMEGLNEKIKQLRIERGINQVDVAKSAGIKQSSYASIEKGITKTFSLKVAKGIAKALNVSFNELFEIDDDFTQKDTLKNEVWNLKKSIEEKEKYIDLQEKVIKNYKNAILEAYDWSGTKDIIGIDAFLEDMTDDKIHSFRQEFFQKLLNWGCFTKKDIELFYDNKIKYSNEKLNPKL